MLELVVIAVVVVVAIVIAAVVLTSRRRSLGLRDTFGPEYERTLQQSGNRHEAERELAGRVERRKELTIVPLPEPMRMQYLAQWQRVQSSFVDAPVESVRQADVLVSQVMTDRGYPMAEFEQRADDVSVDHAAVVENYRSAHAIALASARGPVDTKSLRSAITQYRVLFDELLGGNVQPTSTGAVPMSPPPPPPVDAVAPTVNTRR